MNLQKSTEASIAEQEICLKCGMCCDGTLFLHASLNPGERGNLPEKIERNTFNESEKEYFRLPCLYFDSKCMIYDIKRADVCSRYRCQLLIDLATDKVSKKTAIEIVREAHRQRQEIFKEYHNLSDEKRVLFFKELPHVLLRKIGSVNCNEMTKKRYELLLGSCNILEALLIRHIRSEGDFKDLMSETDINGKVPK